MSQKFEAVIFDLDGTLLNTIGTYRHIMNELLTERGFPNHELDSYCRFIGNGAQNFIRLSLPEPERSPQQINEILSNFHRIYKQTYSEHSQLYTGVTPLLKNLQKGGIKMAVLSNKAHDLTQKCVAHYLADIHFETVIGQSEKHKKPDPSGVFALVKQFELPIEKIVFVGDTEVDLITAANAGMSSVAVTWGYRSKSILENHNPNFIVQHPNELYALFNTPVVQQAQ